MTSTDETPLSAEDVLAEEIAQLNRVRTEANDNAATAFDRTQHQAQLAYDAQIKAAGERYDADRQAAEAAYAEGRTRALNIYRQATGHDQSQGE